MQFQIVVNSDAPIYRQLATQIRRGVATGQLLPGDQLPSVRELSRQLVVNPNTIARAYLEMEREGVLNTRAGVGVFVAVPHSDISKAARKRMLTEKLDELCIEAVSLGFSLSETEALLRECAKQFQWKS